MHRDCCESALTGWGLGPGQQGPDNVPYASFLTPPFEPRAAASTETAAQQPKPKRSSGGKGSALTHAGTMSGARAANNGEGSAGRGKDGLAVPTKPVESRSSHDRLRDSESPCNNAEAPQQVRCRRCVLCKCIVHGGCKYVARLQAA